MKCSQLSYRLLDLHFSSLNQVYSLKFLSKLLIQELRKTCLCLSINLLENLGISFRLKQKYGLKRIFYCRNAYFSFSFSFVKQGWKRNLKVERFAHSEDWSLEWNGHSNWPFLKIQLFLLDHSKCNILNMVASFRKVILYSLSSTAFKRVRQLFHLYSMLS